MLYLLSSSSLSLSVEPEAHHIYHTNCGHQNRVLFSLVQPSHHQHWNIHPADQHPVAIHWYPVSTQVFSPTCWFPHPTLFPPSLHFTGTDNRNRREKICLRNKINKCNQNDPSERHKTLPGLVLNLAARHCIHLQCLL